MTKKTLLYGAVIGRKILTIEEAPDRYELNCYDPSDDYRFITVKKTRDFRKVLDWLQRLEQIPRK